MTDAALSAGYLAFEETFLSEIAKQPADAQWRKSKGASAKQAPNGEDKDWWAVKGLEMTKAYYDWRITNPNLVVWETPQGIPAIELAVNITLADGTMFKGFIDRIFQDFDSGELMVVDTKSGRNAPPPIQLAMYRMAIDQTFGFSPKFGAYWMGRTGTLDTVYDLDKYPPKMVSRWLRDTRKMIDLGLFVPHVSRDCGWCGLREQCYTQNVDALKPDFDSDLGRSESSHE